MSPEELPVEQYTIDEVAQAYEEMQKLDDELRHENEGPWHRVNTIVASAGKTFGFLRTERGDLEQSLDVFRIEEIIFDDEGRKAVVKDADGKNTAVNIVGGKLEKAKGYVKDHAKQGIAGGALTTAVGGLFVLYQKNKK